jgi:phage terminase large subunit-like protein
MNSPEALRTTSRPRFATRLRPDTPSRGHLLAAVAKLIGYELFPWQRSAADVALLFDPFSGLPLFRTVGVGVARQNGKTTLVCARVAMQLLAPRSTVAYTAQDRNLARFKWAEHVDLLMGTPFASKVRRVDRVNGREQLVTVDGSRYLIVTPGEKAGRGLSLDLAVVDEAFAHEDLTLVGALAPTMAARRHAQLWVLSNAGTFRSGLWRHYTDLGRATVDDPTSPMCWLEWAAPDDADVNDPGAWALANPTLDLPGGVTSVALRDAATTLDEATFRREHLNVWADLSMIVGIDPVTWAACRDDDVVVGERIALGIDVTPDRDRGALVAAGPVGDRVALEVIETTSDLERLVERTAEVATRWRSPVVVDRGSPAGSMIPKLERRGVEVRLIGFPDLVRACGDFHDATVAGQVAHRGDYRLTDAVAAATKRRAGDAWVWRRRSTGDISPLVSATLARWGIVDGTTVLVPAVY